MFLSLSFNIIFKMKEIELSQIDWTKLNKDDFISLNEKINESKLTQQRKKRIKNNEKKLLNLRGKSYLLPVAVVERLQEMKSEKPRQKLIESILINYKPIEVETL